MTFGQMPLSSNEKELASVIQRKFCGSKRIRRILNPDFQFDSVYRKFDIPDKEQEQIKTMCQGHSDHLDLKWHAETRKHKEMNLRYSYSKYTYPFVFVSFSFFNMLEKNMLTEWPLTELTLFFTGLKMERPTSQVWGGWGRGGGVLRTLMTWVVGVQYYGAWLPAWRRLPGLHYCLCYISKWPKLTPGRVVRYSENLLWVDTSGVRHYLIKPLLWGQNQITVSWKFISFAPHRGKV